MLTTGNSDSEFSVQDGTKSGSVTRHYDDLYFFTPHVVILQVTLKDKAGNTSTTTIKSEPTAPPCKALWDEKDKNGTLKHAFRLENERKYCYIFHSALLWSG